MTTIPKEVKTMEELCNCPVFLPVRIFQTIACGKLEQNIMILHHETKPGAMKVGKFIGRDSTEERTPETWVGSL